MPHGLLCENLVILSAGVMKQKIGSPRCHNVLVALGAWFEALAFFRGSFRCEEAGAVRVAKVIANKCHCGFRSRKPLTVPRYAIPCETSPGHRNVVAQIRPGGIIRAVPEATARKRSGR